MRNQRRGPARCLLSAACLAALLGGGIHSVWAQSSAGAPSTQIANEQDFDIKPGALAEALTEFGMQSGLQISYTQASVKDWKAKAVKGRFKPAEALRLLLQDTGLEFSFLNASTVLVRKGRKPATPASKLPAEKKPAEQQVKKVTELAEILVTATRSLNADIERTRDDVQPYVVFHRETIERSGAVNVGDFLKQRLPMNTQQGSSNQGANPSGNRSDIDLRGLGQNQTLVLIDGRRTSNIVVSGQLLQADLNGIPLAAIERIEVLPTTASGIYGGDATGGVINVILRRDYRGSEVKLTWDNTFDTDSAQPRIDLSTGFKFGEKTSVMITAAHSQGNVLMNRDRDFVEDYRRQAFANNPDLFLPPSPPPLGYLPNLRSADDSELVLDDGMSLGSNFAHVPAGYAGAGNDGGVAFLASAGSYDLGLANSSQGGGGRAALLNAPKVTSANLTIRHDFTPKVQGFLELAASNNIGHFIANDLPSEFSLPADAPNNPFQQDLQVTIPLPTQDFARDTRSTDRRMTAGVIVKLPADWIAEADYVWSRTSSHYADEVGGFQLTPEGMQALQDGTLDILRDPNAAPLDLTPYLIRPGATGGPFETTTRNPTLILGGPVGELAGGQPMLNVRLEHRDEAFAEATNVGPGFAFTYPAKSQTISGLFAGLTVPLFSALNARPGLQALELQLSVRHDRYAIEGSTNFVGSSTDPVVRIDKELSSTNVTTGFRWQPIEALALRASYGTGFLPPNVGQLVPGAPGSLPAGLFLDPHRGNTPMGAFQYVSGGNPDLQPEESKSLSAGLILTPSRSPGLRLSVDYTRIEKTDNITDIPGFVEGLLDNETRFPGRVTRGPNLPGDPPDWAGPVTAVDLTLVNLARTELEAFDVQLDWTRDTVRWGSFNVFAVATWQTHFKTQLFDDQAMVDHIGFRLRADGNSPLKLKANAGATWQHRDWTLGWMSRYFDSYRPYFSDSNAEAIANDLETQGAAKIKHQIYHDFTVQYAFDGNGWLGSFGNGLSLQLGIRNIFNKTPPRDLLTYSYYGDPRLASYWLTLRKAFD